MVQGHIEGIVQGKHAVLVIGEKEIIAPVDELPEDIYVGKTVYGKCNRLGEIIAFTDSEDEAAMKENWVNRTFSQLKTLVGK
ncbi:hypothetical protein [Bacillus sp. FJAT-44742]|uniref:hypothetical protein n=1 Tax=Bacillus sp. FJAT-44742 TaxID=2014005 RepID=UPI000C2371A1|nr:hypothetical protein [Bacillus sp. FJAT-44742]